MASLSDPFIKRPVMTMLLTLCVIVFGVIGFQRLPVNDLPAVDFPVITVSVNYPGASPTTMARNVATPLERVFSVGDVGHRWRGLGKPVRRASHPCRDEKNPFHPENGDSCSGTWNMFRKRGFPFHFSPRSTRA